MSETKTESAASATGHWGVQTDSRASEYEHLGPMEGYHQMKAQGGRKVEFNGTLYFRQPRNEGSFLGVIADGMASGRPLFVETGPGLPALPPAAKLHIRGRLALEPFANAG